MFDLSNYAFNVHAVPIFIIGFLTLNLGLLAYFSNRAAATNQHFLMLCISIFVWLYGTGMGFLSRDPRLALQWFKLDNFGVMYISVAFYAFSMAFLELRRPHSIRIGYAIASMFAVVVLLTDKFVIGVHKYWWGYYPRWGAFSIPFFLFFFWYMAAAFTGYFQSYRKVLSPIKHYQIKYVLIAFLVAYTGSVDYLPTFGYPIYPLGYIPIFILVSVITFAIFRYRLMNISVVINRSLTYGLLLSVIFIPAYLAVIISRRATFYSLPPLFAGTLIFACGLWIVMKKPKSIPNVTFGLVCLSVAAWLFSDFMMYSTSGAEKAFFWAKISYVGVPYIPAFFYHFCVRILQQEGKRRLVLANYLVSTLFALLIPTLYLIDNSLYSYFWGFYPKAGILHPIFLVYFGLVSGLSLQKLYLGYKAKQGIAPIEAARIKYLFWAFVIGYTASIDFIQNYGFEFYPAGYLFVSLWVIIVTYAISKYQLMDISLILTKTNILSYAKVLALIPFYFVVFMLIRLFTGSSQHLLSGILVATFSILARLLVNLQRQMEKAIERALFRKKYDAYQTLTEFTNAIVSILDLRELTVKITNTISREMGVNKASLFLIDEKSGYIPESICGLDDDIKKIDIRANDPLPEALIKKGEIIIKEEMERGLFVKEYQGIVETMKAIEAEISIPFISKGRLVGFCNLGNKKSRDMYSHEDIQLLTNLAHQAAIAIENARLHYLEKKSLILMKKIDKLDTFSRFAGGMAHEINNPLVTISTFFQLLPQKRNDEEFMDSFSKLAFTETERIRRLTKELLDYGKPREIRFSLEDINQLIAKVVLLIRLEAEKKKIVINPQFAGEIPKIYIDPDQIKQVILNMLLNAIDAIDSEGSITIGTRHIHNDYNDQKRESIQINVTDTGKGIAKEEIDKIFDPFFTTKHTSREREGTGLGLSISHQIVKEHNGFINVESTLGKGTTFLIYLPIDPTSYMKEEKPLSTTSTILDTQ